MTGCRQLPTALGNRRALRRTRRAALAAAAGVAAILAGCGEQRLSESDLVFSTRAVNVDPSRAMVVLPPGGPPAVAVTQRQYDNAIAQTISLATRGRTPGENTIHVAFLTSADLPDGEGIAGNLLKEPGLDDHVLAAEMEERFPGVAMSTSAVFVQNKYGPFGYAYGRGVGNDGCIYVWQRLMRGDSLFRPKTGAASIRLRVCEPGASEASLLRLAYGYALNASLGRSGWDPIGEAPDPAPNLGEAGAPIYPAPQPSFDDVMAPRTTVVRPRPRPARAAPLRDTAPVETAVPDRPLEGYPTVPPPPSR
jgi:hypothetical protein